MHAIVGYILFHTMIIVKVILFSEFPSHCLLLEVFNQFQLVFKTSLIFYTDSQDA